MELLRRISALLGFIATCTCLTGPAWAGPVTVFAAASLKEALDEVARAFEAASGHEITISYAGSSALARQIERGAPADVFISANTEWMDRLEAGGHLTPQSRVDLLGNRLVLIAPAPQGPVRTVTRETDLAALLGDGRLAMALTGAVPAGIYGRAALESLGLWAGVAESVAETDNVRAALALVALRAAPLGIVYATDAAAEPRVGIVAHFPPDSHPPIVYPAALTSAASLPEAASFLDYLRSDAANVVFEAHGFIRMAE